MSGTDIGYAATRRGRKGGRERGKSTRSESSCRSRVPSAYAFFCTDLCAVPIYLRAFGTEIGCMFCLPSRTLSVAWYWPMVWCVYAYVPATQCPVLIYGMVSTYPSPPQHVVLRACYAMSGTDLVYAAISLRACYALSGTDLTCGAPSLCATISLRKVVFPYLPTRLLRDVRY
eukprot:3177848-Rhodomonas_salina.6